MIEIWRVTIMAPHHSTKSHCKDTDDLSRMYQQEQNWETGLRCGLSYSRPFLCQNTSARRPWRPLRVYSKLSVTLARTRTKSFDLMEWLCLFSGTFAVFIYKQKPLLKSQPKWDRTTIMTPKVWNKHDSFADVDVIFKRSLLCSDVIAVLFK